MKDMEKDVNGNQTKGNHTGRKIAIALAGLLAAILISAYISVAVYYSGHFYPRTEINGQDFTNADKISVSAAMLLQMQDYQLRIIGRDLDSLENVELLCISALEVDLKTSVDDADIQAILHTQKSWLWPIYLWGGHVHALSGNVEINEDKLAAILAQQPFLQEENMKIPKDAYIDGYSEVENRFILVPEVEGTQVDSDAVQERIHQAIVQQLGHIDLEEQGCYMEPLVTARDTELQQNIAQATKWLATEITYDWNATEVVLNKERIKDWIMLDNGKLSLVESAIEEFVAENASEYDTYGKTRIFHTTMGYDLSLPSGAFGWLTDREAEVEKLTELINAGSVCSREPEYVSKAPWKGMNDIGNSYVEADLTHQHLYLYQSGELVLETDFVSGIATRSDCITPEGVFGLTYKTTNAVLRGADYETPVNYWMPFHGNFGMHDATWRDAFGGDIYLTDGSHGCLNLPLDKAGEIYQYVSTGFPVICYYYPPGVLPEETYENEYDE
ncbi:MAG: L,D-transpeptidase/peptidoglycan binding protein [Butyrivibrio sp.]|nr:L,D-transpeptidase/peptidoglycan binding protein [Muribaculum sp.]MCM1551980.1 L,D-transpeptidase/peptidoglycan binding protein [Butyrivibrio sp.]